MKVNDEDTWVQLCWYILGMACADPEEAHHQCAQTALWLRPQPWQPPWAAGRHWGMTAWRQWTGSRLSTCMPHNTHAHLTAIAAAGSHRVALQDPGEPCSDQLMKLQASSASIAKHLVQNCLPMCAQYGSRVWQPAPRLQGSPCQVSQRGNAAEGHCCCCCC